MCVYIHINIHTRGYTYIHTHIHTHTTMLVSCRLGWAFLFPTHTRFLLSDSRDCISGPCKPCGRRAALSSGTGVDPSVSEPATVIPFFLHTCPQNPSTGQWASALVWGLWLVSWQACDTVSSGDKAVGGSALPSDHECGRVLSCALATREGCLKTDGCPDSSVQRGFRLCAAGSLFTGMCFLPKSQSATNFPYLLYFRSWSFGINLFATCPV